MRTTRGTKAAIAAGWLVLFGGMVDAEPRVVLGTTSTLELRGKSTLHDFESLATRMDLAVSVATDIPAGTTPLARLAAPGAVKSLVLTVPVTAMRSAKDGLDKNMQKALKADQFPNITFRMSEVVRATPAAEGVLDVIARGELELAGQKQPVELALRATSTPQGVVVEGTKSLLMSAFGVKPPSMMLGTLKTQDRVDISFRLLLTPEGF
jgi:hypothetical protein